MKSFALVLCFLMISVQSFGQNLFDERIRRLPERKLSVFLDRGIFHNGGPKVKSTLKSIRHSYRKKDGFERVVFDFGTNKIPKVYGHISANERKLYIDLFDTSLKKSISSFGKSKFVESINFFPISKESLSVEINFKKSVGVDLFYLSSPGRFVIDIKG